MSALPMPSRRSMLAGAAAVLAVAPADAAEFSALDELIADYRWATEAADAAVEAHWALEDSTELPEVLVQYGKRHLRDDETGEVAWGQWEFRCHADAARHFDPTIEAWPEGTLFPHNVAKLREDRSAVMAELSTQEIARAEAERAAGITAAREQADRACAQAERLRDEIIAYRPVTMAEVVAKNAFLLQLMRDGLAFTEEELTRIFLAGTGHVRREAHTSI